MQEEKAEIGSEFMLGSWRKGKNEYCYLANYPKRYVLSGRTGLYLIAQELKHHNILSVALPAYCCGSMVAPFTDAELEVSFYSRESIPLTGAVLVMDYFGFLDERTVVFAEKCQEAGLKVIVDATQTAFSRSRAYDYADYIVVSYRKWLDCLCAAVYSQKGFMTPEYASEKNDYVETWRNAAKKKRDYLVNGKGDKQNFLDMYAQANHMLATDYIGYRACDSEIEKFENCDSQYIRDTRRKNASVLINGLSAKIDLMIGHLSEEDCPLHVPVLFDFETRARIRKLLINESIYCPCHWPIDEQFPYQRTIYHDTELSLICDQRYSVEDMVREVEAIINGLNKEGIENE